jgi:hypothetical protein
VLQCIASNLMCRGLASCREETIDDSQVYKQQMAAMSGGAQMMDVNKAFASERQALEMVCAHLCCPTGRLRMD